MLMITRWHNPKVSILKEPGKFRTWLFFQKDLQLPCEFSGRGGFWDVSSSVFLKVINSCFTPIVFVGLFVFILKIAAKKPSERRTSNSQLTGTNSQVKNQWFSTTTKKRILADHVTFSSKNLAVFLLMLNIPYMFSCFHMNFTIFH